MATIQDVFSGILGGVNSALGNVLPGGAYSLGNYQIGPIGGGTAVQGYAGGAMAGGAASGSLFEPYRSTLNGAAAQKFIGINPVSGRATWFGPLGKPVLWTGDLRAVRRVRRIAGRARRSVGGR